MLLLSPALPAPETRLGLRVLVLLRCHWIVGVLGLALLTMVRSLRRRAMRLEKELARGLLGWLEDHHQPSLSSGSESEMSDAAIEVVDLTVDLPCGEEVVREAMNHQPCHYGLLGTLRSQLHPLQLMPPSIIHRRKLEQCLLQMQLHQQAHPKKRSSKLLSTSAWSRACKRRRGSQ